MEPSLVSSSHVAEDNLEFLVLTPQHTPPLLALIAPFTEVYMNRKEMTDLNGYTRRNFMIIRIALLTSQLKRSYAVVWSSSKGRKA